MGENTPNIVALGGNDGNNNWMNNPFAYLMFLPFMAGMANGGWNGGGRGIGGAMAGADVALGATTQAQVNNLSDQLQNLSTQMQSNQNADRIAEGQTRTQSQIGDINTGLISGFAGVAQALCGIKSAVVEQGYQSQLGNEKQTATFLQQMQQLANITQSGFTQLGFQIERNACDIKTTSSANTQKIVDTLNNHWGQEQLSTIQQLRDEIGRRDQSATLITTLVNALGGAAAASAKASA